MKGTPTRRRLLLLGSALLAGLLAAAPLPADYVWYQITCWSVNLVDAAGYPDQKRSYTFRAQCRLSKLHSDKKKVGEILMDFVAEGATAWAGTMGKTRESLLIAGKKVQTSMSCIHDPFVTSSSNPACTDAKLAGDVDLRLYAAMSSKPYEGFFGPILAKTVKPEIAEALSKAHGSGSPPPPPPPPEPKPKVTVPTLKTGPSGPAKMVSPHAPVPRVRSGQQPAGGGAAKANPAGVLLVISPTPVPTRAAGRRLRLPPAATPTPSGRRE